VLLVCSAEEVRECEPGKQLSSPYGAAKMAATMYGRLFENLYGLPVVLTRPLMAYGPGQGDAKLIPYVIRSLIRNEPPQLSSCSRYCDFVFVDDVIRGFLRAAIGSHVGGTVLELGTGRAVMTRDVVERLARLSGASAPPAFGALPDRPETPMIAADLGTTERLIGWTPRWSLDAGLAATFEHYAAAAGRPLQPVTGD
jgi:nucleoside-diphosphate-sugar epimerase